MCRNMGVLIWDLGYAQMLCTRIGFSPRCFRRGDKRRRKLPRGVWNQRIDLLVPAYTSMSQPCIRNLVCVYNYYDNKAQLNKKLCNTSASFVLGVFVAR